MGDFWNDTVMEAARNDTLMELLRMLPRWRWGERSSEEWTFLHYACYGNNEAALVALAHELDVDARDHAGSSPAHLAALLARPRVLEVLCAAGASLRALDNEGYSPLDSALCSPFERGLECAAVLVANGVRLSTARERWRATPELDAFEQGVLHCRAAVVALLRTVPLMDKCVARALWATRWDSAWTM